MIKRYFTYTKKYRAPLIGSIVCVLTECLFELVIPMLMADLVDVGVANKDVQYVMVRSIAMVACALISLALGVVYARLAAIASQGFGAELRRAEFEKVQAFSFSNMDHFQNSSLVTRLTSDVTVLQNALSGGMRPLLRGVAMMTMGLVLALRINAQLALVFVVALPILAIALFFIANRLRPMYGKLQRAIDRVNAIVQENLIAIRVVKAYVRKDYECEKFEEVNKSLQDTSQTAFSTAVLNAPVFQAVMYATIIGLLWFGGNLVYTGGLKVGELTGFLSYVMLILNSLMMISAVFLLLTRSIASGLRILEVMDEKIDIEDEDTSVPASVKNGGIEFSHVYFKYSVDAAEYVLSDINLNIQPGQTVGIIGGTGSAKSSLVQLIPRLYDITSGSLLIDGRDIKEYPVAHLRDAIGMVLQKNTLFTGTVKENLMWGNPCATQDDIEWACHVAAADEFIQKLPNGYDTELGQGGNNVSGGQKQRLCIARALLKLPKVLIFDDSTSAVDTATEAHIREGLAAALPHTTKIIIAQRISSVEHADQIVILDDGQVNAVGTHDQLLQNNKIYQEIFNAQKKGALA